MITSRKALINSVFRTRNALRALITREGLSGFRFNQRLPIARCFRALTSSMGSYGAEAYQSLPWHFSSTQLRLVGRHDEDVRMEGKSILQRFQEEVASSGPESTLPCNLTDYWLIEIQQHLEQLFESIAAPEGLKSERSMALPLAAVIHILFAKGRIEKLEVSMEEMFHYFEYYRTELALEEIRRKTDLRAEPASIETIFTNRNVSITEIS